MGGKRERKRWRREGGQADRHRGSDRQTDRQRQRERQKERQPLQPLHVHTVCSMSKGCHMCSSAVG